MQTKPQRAQSQWRVVREHGGKVAADLEAQLNVSDHTEEQGHKHLKNDLNESEAVLQSVKRAVL